MRFAKRATRVVEVAGVLKVILPMVRDEGHVELDGVVVRLRSMPRMPGEVSCEELSVFAELDPEDIRQAVELSGAWP